MNLEQKQEVVEKLKENFKRCSFIVMSDFQGMDVASMEKLRREIKSKGLNFWVVKNTLIAKAASEFSFSNQIVPYLKGMTAITCSAEDPGTPIKILKEFQKEDPRLKIKCGIIDGKVIESEKVIGLADMPNKTTLRAMFLGLLTAPAQRLLALLQAPQTEFLCLLNAYGEKKKETEKS